MSKPVLLFSVTKRDLIRQTFRAGGKGGQHQNKTESAVRFIHEPSGARGESREYREQPRNERAAFERMARTPEFQRWAKVEAARKMGTVEKESPEQIRTRVDAEVEAGLANGQVVVEYYDADMERGE